MLKERFRKFLPVVVDLETGGFNYKNNAILEIAIQLIDESDSIKSLSQKSFSISFSSVTEGLSSRIESIAAKSESELLIGVAESPTL